MEMWGPRVCAPEFFAVSTAKTEFCECLASSADQEEGQWLYAKALESGLVRPRRPTLA